MKGHSTLKLPMNAWQKLNIQSGVLLFIFLFVSAHQRWALRTYPTPIALFQGDAAVFLVKADAGQEINRVEFNHTSIPFYPLTANIVQVLLGVNSDEAVGETDLQIEFKDKKTAQLKFTVQKTDFPRRDITLPKDYVDFTPEEVAKINSDNDKMIAMMSRYNETKLWDGEFIRPVPGKVVSPFGQLRFSDGEPKSPHTALDLQGATGDPVHPTNSGVVVMAETFFLPGNTIIIDHGQGIFSMYFHLNKIRAQLGDTVLKSTVIGDVGKTGRATGPHLHFGMRMNRAKVDPLKLIGLRFYKENSPELAQLK